MFLDREGNDQTGFMMDDPRPTNVCHLGIHASIDMSNLSEAFTPDMNFELNYFLALPQSYYSVNSIPANIVAPTSMHSASVLGSAADLDNNFSTPAKPFETHEALFNSCSSA